MREYITTVMPSGERKRKWLAIAITVMIAGLLTVWGIYGIGQYGVALFIFTPIFIGACSTILYGIRGGISKRQAWQISFTSLGIYAAGLVLFAMEGLICIAMAAPFGILFTWIGSVFGYLIIGKDPDKGPGSLLILLLSIPAMAFIDREQEPELHAVTSSIEIKADPATVWKYVVEFPKLQEPTEFIFQTGIAYPIDARIEGKGVGAIRYCNFSTGSFVEPITVWDEPALLRFDVVEQPEPLKELSFWDINAPHLHDYFISKEGQFKLSLLPNGNTLLEGTTWYYHNIKPRFYWKIWSDHIIHKIHERVLSHIKQNAEEE